MRIDLIEAFLVVLPFDFKAVAGPKLEAIAEVHAIFAHPGIARIPVAVALS